MNIFALDDEPRYAAMYQCDKHVVKMTLESAQLLSTVHRVYATTHQPPPAGIYSATHVHHPSAAWAGRTSGNYSWLYAHFASLASEYAYRYGKTHKSWSSLKHQLRQPPAALPRGPRTEFAQAMPDIYKNPTDPVDAYRLYYAAAKADFLYYTRRPKPWWLDVYKSKAEQRTNHDPHALHVSL